MLKIGSSTKLNSLIGVGNALVTSTDEMEQYPLSLKRGSIIYNTETREIKIADGETPINRLGDHQHPLTHAPLIHDHIHGANIPWLVANPQLWYTDDLANHPDLVPLDGRELPDNIAEHLSTVYTGAQLATLELNKETNNGFENIYCVLSTGTYSDGFPSSNLFNDPIDPTNLHKFNDQWMIDETDLNTTVIINLVFKNNLSFRPIEYQFIPCNGTEDNVFAVRPTPRSWVLEGYVGSSQWEVLDRHENVDPEEWNQFAPNAFRPDTTKICTAFKITITKWNAGSKPDMQLGLRRFWLFGRKNGAFALPLIESPDPNFTWVIPYKNLNVGLHHEDVGDIGFTSILPQYMPKYRLSTDGRSLKQSEYEQLYNSIGHKEDRIYKPSLYTVNSPNHQCTSYYNSELGEVTFTSSDSITVAPTISFEFTPIDPFYLGKYRLDFNNYARPSEWSIEVYDTSTTQWTTIQHFIDVEEQDFRKNDYTFYIAHEYADYKVNKFRLNILKWDTVGLMGGRIKFYSHKKDEFYIPNLSTEDGRSPYIVSQLSAVDVTPDIIQDLQLKIISLTQTIAQLQSQVNTLDRRLNDGD